MKWHGICSGTGATVARDEDGNIVLARFPAAAHANVETEIRRLCKPHEIRFIEREDHIPGVVREVLIVRVFRWAVELEVDATWVADGFDLDDERAHRMLAEHLPYAYGHELRAKVIKAPNPKSIRKEQGYRDDS